MANRRFSLLAAVRKGTRSIAIGGAAEDDGGGALRQGVGRLIRCKTDVGVAVILDKRIAEKSYGRKFLKSLPPMLSTRRVENISRFLEEAAYARAS